MSAPLSSRSAKVKWVIEHPEVWQHWPTNPLLIERRIMEGMQRDGLVSPNTNLYGIMDVGRLISEARRHNYGKKAKS